MEFEKRKAATLAALGVTETDKSPKGSLDVPIIPLIDAINNHSDYFTTSSCSGRVSILSTPTPSSVKVNKKARGGSWLYITHDLADKDIILEQLFKDEVGEEVREDVVFRFEPLIVAVECRDVSAAHNLVSIAKGCGFRESGISGVGKRVIVGIRCSIRMEVPLGERGRVLVGKEYVEFLVKLANEKMEANWRRTDGFFQSLLLNGFSRLEVDAKMDLLEMSEVEDCVDGVESEVQSDRAAGEAGLLGASDSVPVNSMVIVGESLERLFLWGHSACLLEDRRSVIVFGGFGGEGRHARRNDCLCLDAFEGTLEVVKAKNCPPPRLGHTASMIGNRMFVIGGRADPVNILNDVWVLDTVTNEWKYLECHGNPFKPRHRHAAAVVGSNIYVFGGLNNDSVFSSLHVLDTLNHNWSDISGGANWPSARHSHTMVTIESQLFIFGGYDGNKVLGDLYRFDVRAHEWHKEHIAGRMPCVRFSHSMFVYRHYLGIMGGCPVNQTSKELALLDLNLRVWKHVTLSSVGKDLFVRSTANVLNDNLVIIGGGAACYAFGTKFSEPITINLLAIVSDCNGSSDSGKAHNHGDIKPVVTSLAAITCNGKGEVLPQSDELHTEPEMGVLHWVLVVGKDYAKIGKDILKTNGWLDLTRKVHSQEDGNHICFPLTKKFCSLFQAEKSVLVEDSNAAGHQNAKFAGKISIAPTDVFLTLEKLGARVITDDVGELRKTSCSPLRVMREAILSLLKCKDLPEDLLEQLPARWERLGDIVVLPVTSFKDQIWDSLGDELWRIVAKSLGARRLARQGRVASTGTRDSTLEILVGENGWVEHRENGIVYSFDATKCMFSWGNLSEKLRMAGMDCKDEVVVDLFAGIGYFVLPFLVRAKAKQVYACEWNPNAILALRRNLEANSVADKCIVLEGDNRLTAPKGIANRVNLGLLPTSELCWETAVTALRSDGGILHVHANVKDSEETSWALYLKERICDIAKSLGHSWGVSVDHIERVKWYAPHIRHLVADVRCTEIQR